MKNRHKRASGGADLASEEMNHKNQKYTYESKVNNEAEERKAGGRAKRKMVGKVEGEHAKHHAGRAPRKNGGRTGSDSNPFTSARHGTQPAGYKVDKVME